jgi:hypothetical protein
MNDLILTIWVIGCLYATGKSVTQTWTSKAGGTIVQEIVASAIFTVILLVACVLLWPFVLGAMSDTKRATK